MTQGDKFAKAAWKESMKRTDEAASGKTGIVGTVISMFRGGRPLQQEKGRHEK